MKVVMKEVSQKHISLWLLTAAAFIWYVGTSTGYNTLSTQLAYEENYNIWLPN
jgi:hypothetical protein